VGAAALETGLRGLPARGHLGHEDSLVDGQSGVPDQLGEQLYRSDVDPAAGHASVGNQLGNDTPRGVDGDGKPDTHRAARGAVDHGVDTDDLAAAVDQRPARVAGVDGRVGLDELVEHDAVVVAERSAQGADDAYGHGPVQGEGVADGEHLHT